MAETQNQPNHPNITLPQRSITITGALTARLFQAAIRASRIDLRSVQVAMSRPSVRDPSNRAIDRLVQALGRFESELNAAEKELNEASRETGNGNGNGRSGQNGNRRPPRDARTQSAAGNATPTSANGGAATGGQANASGEGTAKPGKRSRNRSKGTNGAQPSATQQHTQQTGAQKASPTPAPTKPAEPSVVADSSAHAQAEQQPVAAQTDVAAHIHAL